MISLLLNIQRLIMKSSLILGCFIIITSMISCSVSKKSTNHSDLDRLAQLMVGTFNTKAQSARDSQFYNIQLKMCRIWTQDPNQYWLYVEQATVKNLNKPYRQRIYKLEQISKKQFVSKVYNIPSPELAVNGCAINLYFKTITFEDIILKEGCSVYLNKIKDNLFVGSTKESGCESNLRGASYATSEVRISKDTIQSLDRGYDANGKQVWGSEHGAYQFVKTP